MGAEGRPHFGVGHFCGGCPMEKWRHTGCVVDGTARRVETRDLKEEPREAKEDSGLTERGEAGKN